MIARYKISNHHDSIQITLFRAFRAQQGKILSCQEEMMAQINWQSLIIKICFWLLIEAIFNVIGIDNLADYSEFLLMTKTDIIAEHPVASGKSKSNN